MAWTANLIASIAAGVGAAVSFVAGAAGRRRKLAAAAAVDWQIHAGGKTLRVFGPYRDADGRIHGISDRDQRAWAATLGAREPTQAEFDQIWATADVQVPVKLWPKASGPLTALDDDARRAGAKPGDKIAAGKTWISTSSGKPTNYGLFVPVSEVKVDAAGVPRWQGIKTYATSLPGWRVLQSPGTKHNAEQADNSQAGYAVRELEGGVGPELELPPPPGDGGTAPAYGAPPPP